MPLYQPYTGDPSRQGKSWSGGFANDWWGRTAPAQQPVPTPEVSEPISSRAEEYRSPGDNSSPAGRTIPAGIGTSSYDGHIVWWSGFDPNASISVTSFVMVFKDCLFAQSFTLVKLFADEQPLGESSQSIRFYNGTQTAVDPVLTAALGASMASAWPGYVYAVFENFDCSTYGNRVPLIRAVLAGSVTAIAADEDQSTLSFGAFGGGYSNTAFAVDPVKGHHYQIVSNGDDDAWVVTVDIASLQEINRVRVFGLEDFGRVRFPVMLFGTDYIACTVYNDPDFTPALLNVQTGEIVATLATDTTGDVWGATTKRAALISNWGSTKFLVIVEHAVGPAFTGNHMGLFVADTTSGTMDWIIHPYASPAAGSGSGAGAAEFSVEWGPTVDGVISLWYTDLDNVYVALISATGFTSGLFYAEPNPAKSPTGLAYDPTRAVLAVNREDGSWLKLNAVSGAVISTHAGSITDFNINHWADDIDVSTTYNAFYHSHRPGFIVATRGQVYGDIYEISLSDFSATLLIDRSDFSNDDVAIYFDQHAGVMTEGSATAGIINRVTLGDVTPDAVDLVDIFTQLATFDDRFDVGDLDFTGFAGNETSGLKLENDTTIDNLEGSIAELFDVKIVESDGDRKYTFPPRDGAFAIDVALDPEDFVENGSQTIEKTFGAGEDEFVGAAVQYFDKDSDYKKLEQSYQRPLGVYDVTRSKKKRTINSVLSLSAGQAAQLATIAVFRSVLGNETYSFGLVPGMSHVEPADIVSFDFRGFTTIARVKEATLSAAYTQEVRAYQFLQFAEATFTGAGLVLPEEEEALSTRLIYLDVPLLFPGHDLGGAGLVQYAQIAGYGSGSVSGTLYKSPDGTTFASQGAVYSVAPVVGVITTITGTPDDPFVQDEANSIAVVVSGGDINDLVTISDDQFDAGVNAAAIGGPGRWVLLWFQTVSISSGVATLSDLMWGVRGSEVWIEGLAVGDQFVLLNPSHYIRFRNAVADLDDAFLYKAGNPVFPLAVIPTVSYVATGVAETPYAPTNLDALVDGSDIDLSWDYRSRLATGINPTNHGEASLAFEIDIVDSGTVTRTLTATTNAKTYLAADIISDFGGIPAEFTFRVYMMSAVVGRGYPGEATIGVPAAFGTGDWSVMDDETGGDITIMITTLPGGDLPVTDLEYQIDGGSWISLSGTTVGDYPVSGLTDDVEVDVAIRAVNAWGNGTASATKPVTPTTVGSGSDPHFASVVLLVSFDGSDGATSATDDSPVGNALTFTGNAQIDTAQSKFGGASLLSDGTGDFVTAPAGTSWDFGTGDVTIEFFAEVNTKKDCGWLCRANTTGPRWAVFMLTSGVIQLYHGGTLIVSSTTDISVPTWPHIAICRASGTTRLFVNGVQEASSSTVWDVTASGSAVLHIGTDPASTSSRSINGWLDEVRITKGVGRYTSNFTAPASAFPRS